jgi:hypothetical protein
VRLHRDGQRHMALVPDLHLDLHEWS